MDFFGRAGVLFFFLGCWLKGRWCPSRFYCHKACCGALHVININFLGGDVRLVRRCRVCRRSRRWRPFSAFAFFFFRFFSVFSVFLCVFGVVGAFGVFGAFGAFGVFVRFRHCRLWGMEIYVLASPLPGSLFDSLLGWYLGTLLCRVFFAPWLYYNESFKLLIDI